MIGPTRLLLRADRALWRGARFGDHARGDLRSGCPDRHVHRSRTDDSDGERHRDGLTGYVLTRDLAKGLATSERIQAGMIGLNRGLVSDPAAPFGGMKQSGLGREGSTEGIYEFTETQYIATNW